MNLPPMIHLPLRQIVKSWLPAALPMFDNALKMEWTKPLPLTVAQMSALAWQFRDQDMFMSIGNQNGKRIVIVILSEEPISEVFDVLEEKANA